MIIIFILFFIVLFFELANNVAFGKFIFNYQLENYYRCEDDKCDILHNANYNGKFISTISFSIFSKYYINSIGQVFRWSKLHKDIEKLYRELK